MAIIAMVNKNDQSTLVWNNENKKPMSEFIEMMTNEVPIAFYIGNFKKLIKAGIKKTTACTH